MRFVYTQNRLLALFPEVIATEISIRRLVAGLSPLRTRFTSVIIHVEFILENVQWDGLFFDYVEFTLAVSFHLCSIFILSSTTNVM
jgi:hypothetical protein